MRIAERVNKSITLGTTNYIGSGWIQRLENLFRFIRLCDVLYPAGSFYEQALPQTHFDILRSMKILHKSNLHAFKCAFPKFFHNLKFASVAPVSQ
jgi:hypothetical protein